MSLMRYAGILWLIVLFAGEAMAQNPATAVFPAAVVTDNELLCWANNFQTRLSSRVEPDDATIPVWSTAGFCAPSVVKIGSELIKISAVGSGSLTVASGGRGYDGTTAAEHYSSSLVNGFVPAAWFHQIAAEVKATQTALGPGFSMPDSLDDLSGDTDAVPEGAVNLYFTQARARAAVSGGANVTYTEGTGVIAVNAFPYGSLSGVPATFAPSAHAAAHQAGGGDVLNLAGLSVAWGDLTSVPASFAPSAHAASHGAGQSDAITIAESQISDLAHFDGAYSSLSGVPLTFAPTAHASSHQDGGADELTIAWGQLSGVPGSFAPSAHAASHGAGQPDAVTITEAQISDLAHFDGAYGSLSGVPATFAPSAHAASHGAGQSDAIAIAESQISDLAHFSGVYGDLSGVPATFAPSAHAASHQSGGGDVLNLAGLSVAWGDLTSVPASFAPSAHAASHGSGQADAVTITEAQISDLAHFGGAFSDLTGAATDAQIPDTITLTSIGQAGDVDVTGIADGECLVYDGVTDNRLEPGACGGILTEVNDLETDGAEGIADTEIYIGTGAGTGNYAAISGDATLANNGALTVVDDSHAHTTTTISELDAGDVTTGTFADARISASSVAQHIAADISFSQPAGGDPVHRQFAVETTITAANCRTDAGTVTLTIYESTAPFSGTDSTVSTINCTTSGVAGSISDATIAANSYVRFVYTSEAGGVGATSTSLRFTQ